MNMDISKKKALLEQIVEIAEDIPAEDVRDIMIYAQGYKAATQYRKPAEGKESEAS